MGGIDFSDLEDSREWSGDTLVTDTEIDTSVERTTRETTGGHVASRTGEHVEKCPKCVNGTFCSYTGRPVGPCFKCKGTGKLTFKTSRETRDANRERAARKKTAAADAKLADAKRWLEENPERAAFLDQSWEFPVSLKTALYKWGSLTDNQLAAVDKCIVKQAVKAEARKSEQSDINLTDILSGLYAVPDGDTRLKVRINVVTRGKWKGWVFVDDGAEYGQCQKYGAQRPGEQYTGKIQD